MAVAGYAENAPTDANDTDEGRAHNRRVDLVLLSTEGQRRNRRLPCRRVRRAFPRPPDTGSPAAECDG